MGLSGYLGNRFPVSPAALPLHHPPATSKVLWCFRAISPLPGSGLIIFDHLLDHWQAVLTAAVMVATLCGLLFIQRAPDMIMLGGVVVLMLTGILAPGEALKGMANEGMIAVAALFVVAAGV